MPYTIIPSGRGYKVRSIHGAILSKRPLSLEKAKKQRTAVQLEELRSMGRMPPRK
jgi:hypothetical protein